MRLAVIALSALSLAACGRDDHEPPAPAESLTPAVPTSTPPTTARSTPAAVSGGSGASQSEQPRSRPAAPGEPVALIARWREALETHDYGAARAAFGNGGADSGMSAQAFAAAWDKYRIIDITVGEGEQEGAAGSLYYEAPVSITGIRRDGAPYNLSGTITLRRVNGVDGATPEQLAWRIRRTTLKP